MSGQELLPSSSIDLPLLPLRDVVVFPHMVIPLFVGRAKSIKALETAMAADRRIMLVAQKAAAKDEPSAGDMFEMGCVASILQMLKLPDGTVKVLVEGFQRAHVERIVDGEEHFTATLLPVAVADERIEDDETEIEALRRASCPPAEVGCVEAHGTGTALGDPIEMRSLAAAVLTYLGDECALPTGSVKANAGHGEPAAGGSGLLRLAVGLGGDVASPNAQLRTVNPHIAAVFEGSPTASLPSPSTRSSRPPRSPSGSAPVRCRTAPSPRRRTRTWPGP